MNTKRERNIELIGAYESLASEGGWGRTENQVKFRIWGNGTLIIVERMGILSNDLANWEENWVAA